MMKSSVFGKGVTVHTLQISWHPSAADNGKEAFNLPILSCDFSPAPTSNGEIGTLATCGNDNMARLWRVSAVDGEIKCVYLATLAGHEKVVNVVRFSPCGKFIATGGDDGRLLVWIKDEDKSALLASGAREASTLSRRSQKNADDDLVLHGEEEEGGGHGDDGVKRRREGGDISTSTLSSVKRKKNGVDDEGKDEEEDNQEDDEASEVWRCEHRMSVATDVFDVAWSPNGQEICACSTDGRASMFTRNGERRGECGPHGKYVQGAAWDPRGAFLCTSSNDKSVRVWSLWHGAHGGVRRKQPKAEHILKKWLNSNNANVLSIQDQPVKTKLGSYFHDDSCPTFFRRLAWSPDGMLLVCPTGKSVNLNDLSSPSSGDMENACHVFTRSSFPHPVLQLPSKYPSVAVRFSPILYQPIEDSSSQPWLSLPYRMIFAIAHMDATVAIYDTHHIRPICVVRGIHYEPLNDIAWSPCGQHITVCSTDGYCTVIAIEPLALGNPMPAEQQVQTLMALQTPQKSADGSTNAATMSDAKKKKSTAKRAQPKAKEEEGGSAKKPFFPPVDPTSVKKALVEEFVEEDVPPTNDIFNSLMPMVLK